MENPCEETSTDKKTPQRRTPAKKWTCRIQIAVCAFLVLGAGFAAGWVTRNYFNQGEDDASQNGNNVVRANTSTYHFVNPLLECNIGSDVISKNRPKPSKIQLQNMIEDMEMQGRASFVSFYYRDLNNGPWIGINQDEPFYPASLLKLPVAMYYYKKAETDPSILSQKILIGTLDASTNDMYYKPDQAIESGKEYTVGELIQHMIVYSDNGAAEALISFALPTDPVQSVFDDLGLQKDASNASTQITIMNYAMLLRVLFNSSYLHPDSSEQVLKLLSQTTFTQGLDAELPDGIVVSHKFGEREKDDGTRQLHDCGIVYKTNFPYLICIMTRGTDVGKLSTVIQDLSKEVYSEISQQDQWKP